MITDEHKIYAEPIKFNLPGAKHVRTGFKLKRVQRNGKRYRFSEKALQRPCEKALQGLPNPAGFLNPHERLNGDIRALLYGRRGFKSFESAKAARPFRTMDMYRMQQVAFKQGKQEWFWNSILWVK